VAGIYTLLGKGERGTKSVAGVIVSVAAVLAGALLTEWLFVLYSAAARRRITSSVPSGWIAKIGALSMRALLDLTTIVIFIVAALTFFSFFLTAPPASAFSQGLPESSLRYRLAQKCITLPSLLCYCCWLPLTYFASILIDNSTPSGLIKPGWLFRCRFFESPEDAVFWQVCILRYSKLQQRYRTQMPWEV